MAGGSWEVLKVPFDSCQKDSEREMKQKVIPEPAKEKGGGINPLPFTGNSWCYR